MRPIHSGKTYEFVLAEINDTHEVLDRFGVPRTAHHEKLSLAQRAALLEKAAVAARIATAATQRARLRERDWREFY